MEIAQLHVLTDFLHHHPHLAGIITCIIAFTESLAIIGTIVPGSVTMTAIGILIGTAVLPAFTTIAWAVVGAIGGDSVSFWFGHHYKQRLFRIWPFNRYPEWIIRGEKFFARHGGKSILLGRFFGPMRSMVPLIAGMLSMTWPRFLFAAIPTAMLWAMMYMTPGIIVGALSLELPPKLATQFILGVIILIFIVWLLTWLVKWSFKTFYKTIDITLDHFWHFCQRQRSLKWLPRLLASQDKDDHTSLVLLAFALLCAIVFALILHGITTHAEIALLNQPLHHLLRSLHNRWLESAMIVFTILGEAAVLLTATVLIALWLFWQRQHALTLCWLLLVALAGIVGQFFKFLVKEPRPTGYLLERGNYSFPSGHALLSITVFGFMAVLISSQLPKEKRTIPYWVAGGLILLVSFSRVYLGAHWFTDVAGGLFLGATLLMLVLIVYRHFIDTTRHIHARHFITLCVGSVLIPAFLYGVTHFHQERLAATPTWPSYSVNLQRWWEFKVPTPLYRDNRLGHAAQPFNVQWAGYPDEVSSVLQQHGWEIQSGKFNLPGTLQKIAVKNQDRILPLLPQLYQNHPPVIVMTKKVNGDTYLLQLWVSSIRFDDQPQPLLLGTVNRVVPAHQRITLRRKNHKPQLFYGEIEKLTPDISGFDWRIVTVDPDDMPDAVRQTQWDGKILLVGHAKRSDK